MPRAVGAAVLLALLVAGCGAGLTPRARPAPATATAGVATQPAWTDAQCYELMESRDNWRFSAALFSGLGGAGGITAAALPDEEPNGWPRWTVGSVSVVSGAIGAAAVLVAQDKAEDFERFCTVEPPAPVSGEGTQDAGT